jgi:hypothetical protein
MHAMRFLDPRVAVERLGDHSGGLIVQEAHTSESALFEDLGYHIAFEPTRLVADVDILLFESVIGRIEGFGSIEPPTQIASQQQCHRAYHAQDRCLGDGFEKHWLQV